MVHSVVKNEFRNVPEIVADYQDLVQIGTIGLLHANANWDPERAPFHSYSYRRVKGIIQDWLQKNWKHHSKTDYVLDDIDICCHETPQHFTARKEDLGILKKHLKRLSSAEQKLIHLHYFCGLSGKRIAEILDCTESNVSIGLRRARARLRSVLEAHGIMNADSLYRENHTIKENGNGKL